ncbi:MAG TPA: TerC family protein [Gemmatimonadaceae bacterium]|nr:TerC family protein [Gemmatimonadaceae bacterium]
MLHTSIWFWVGFIAFVLAMLSLDLGVFHRTPHVVRPKEAGIWVAVWVSLALLFAVGLYFLENRHIALTFLTGYVIEEALSADNIFVMVLIFEYFRVPKASQHRVLFYGILGALIMRGLFILAGTALIHHFQWVMYVFGAVLVFTGIRMAFTKSEEFDGENNRIVKLVRRVMPVSRDYRGSHFFTVENGKRLATPLLLVLVLIEVTDLIFAIDSIPAIFGVTTHSFIVFTSNIFAVMGLRSMYFLLAAVVDRFHLLKYGLAVILSFVGFKMLTEHFFRIDITLSLAVILGVLAVSIVASLIWTRNEPPKAGTEGR